MAIEHLRITVFMHMQYNCIEDVGAQHMASSLEQNTTLTSINLEARAVLFLRGRAATAGGDRAYHAHEDAVQQDTM